MKPAPRLATITGAFLGRQKCRMNVRGGLHYIRGNKAPYFSLTADIMSGGHMVGGGCMHEEILKHFPRFKDLSDLHLCDDNGAPGHDASNGWYILAGALGGMGEQYHVGNSELNFPLPKERIDPAKAWNKTEHRKPTLEECLQFFANHCRIGIEEARHIAETVRLELGQPNEAYDVAEPYTSADYARCRAKLAEIMHAMRPRWKSEASACIAKHGLTVYGDEYQQAA